MKEECSRPLCSKRAYCRSWCSMHYKRWYLYGVQGLDSPAEKALTENGRGQLEDLKMRFLCDLGRGGDAASIISKAVQEAWIAGATHGNAMASRTRFIYINDPDLANPDL